MTPRLMRLREYVNILEKFGKKAALDRWEKRGDDGTWTRISGIGDLEDPSLSIRERTTGYTIGDQDVRPAGVAPEKGTTIFLPHIATKTEDFVINDVWTGADYQLRQLENGIVFLARSEVAKFGRGLRNLIRSQIQARQ